ncbi:hypothetical protein LZ554_007516 [Drepanopeziza brunnea f. sp. 'monogermtubi']|nr:hypothetical protein LZ554_007516 [Drepanopeziza brunnea f. sp. 'monogermtubi']
MEIKPGDPEGSTTTSGKAIQKDAEAISKDKDPAPKEGAPSSQDAFPDPDEDDLDDLDDMLDEFTPTRPEPPSPSSKPTTAPKDPIADGISDEDFAVQLQAGMAELMGELETSPDVQSQLAQMLKELGGVAALDSAAGQSSAAGPSTKKKPAPRKENAGKAELSSSAPDESFQETIKKTMERMQNSGDQATAAAASDNTDDILAQMMKAMESGGLDGEGGEEEFSKMLLGMMEQLTNKEILYEPMKELDDKFPGWMEKNAATADAADLKRYREQQVYVSEIVKRFETKTYKDENVADRDYIVERMQKMQAAGSPPADLVGDMAAAQEAFGGLDGAPEEGCPTQ